MTELYKAELYDRHRPVSSFWASTVTPPSHHDYPPLTTDTDSEVAIIGGGITGLSAALHLAEMGVQVRVLEAAWPGWGASGRNGGFCCIGSTARSGKEVLHKFGRNATQQFYHHQREATELVRHLAQTESMAIDIQGEGEIKVAHYPSRLSYLEHELAFYEEVADYPCELWSQKDLRDRAFHSPLAHGALWVKVGFGLNPLKYSLALADAAKHKGATLHSQSPVTAWEKADGWHRLRTPTGSVRAKQVLIATNGYTQDSIHPTLQGRLLPVISHIFTTRPLTAEERDAHGWHTEIPLYNTRTMLSYFRLLKDGRILFGQRGDTVGSLAARDRYQKKILRHFHEMFPAWQHLDVTHVWNGLMGFSFNLTPYIGFLDGDRTVACALAYHGNGVAAGTWSGRTAALLMGDRITPDAISPVYRQPLKAFPLPGLRIQYLHAACSLFRLQDALP